MATQHTTLLIVGAGPTGLATALSLLKNGFRDFIIVDAMAKRGLASRAMAIHAATLEALEAIDCAEPLVKRGTKGRRLQFGSRTTPLLQIDITPSLDAFTAYPYYLIVSQSTTEEILEAQLQSLGVQVLRSERAIGLKSTPSGDLEVSFDSSKVISAKYVIGADGARSVIRQMAGVGFTDPDGHPSDEALGQMVLADVVFSADSPHLPKDGSRATGSAGRALLVIPVENPGTTEDVYRVAFNVPLHLGPPPSNPTIQYIQQHLDEAGPADISSDPSINPNPIQISKIIWTTRFRTHSSIADRFLVRMGNEANRKTRGIVLLLGDAAHIHSPTGGQGMNLGLRDAIGLGSVLSAHIASTPQSLDENDRRLEEYATVRRQRALTTIQLTKRIMAIGGVMVSTTFLSFLGKWFVGLLVKIPFVRRKIAWNLSGLGNR